ncbi:unnamed protein product, partial [Scytosiphon promiscuus]
MSFLDSDGNSSSGGSSSESEGEREARPSASRILGRGDDDTIRVNKKFAKTFEIQKREQELQAAKHLDLGSDEGDSGSESDSETEDEDAEMLTPALDLQIMKTINKIRSKDPDIYDNEKEWFDKGDNQEDEDGDDDDDDDDDEPGNKKKTKKPMRYKDVVREQILHAETAEDAISSDEDSDDDGG